MKNKAVDPSWTRRLEEFFALRRDLKETAKERNPWDDLLGPVHDSDPGYSSEDELETDQPRVAFRRSAAVEPPPRGGTGRAASSKGPDLPPQPPVGDASALIQLEMLKVLQQMQRRGKRSEHSFDSEDDVMPKTSGKAALDGVHRLRRRVHKEPQAGLREYVREVKDKLGVSDARQVWSMKDWSRRLSGRFGRFKGMWRIHHMTSEVLQLLFENRREEATAFVVQLQKALVQMVADSGDWSTAALCGLQRILCPPRSSGAPSWRCSRSTGIGVPWPTSSRSTAPSRRSRRPPRARRRPREEGSSDNAASRRGQGGAVAKDP